MSISLVVVQPFGDYARGDRITDPAVIETLLRDKPQRVNRIEMAAESAPAAPAKE